MKNTILLALVSIAVGGLACGSGGVTIEEYIVEMDSLRARLESERTVQRTELEAIHQEGDTFTEQERAEHNVERILFAIRTARELSLELKEVEPAKQARVAHEAYITAIDGFATAFEATLADDSYHELFFPPHPRPVEHLTLAQNEDSTMSLSLPSVSEAVDNRTDACVELSEFAFSIWEGNNKEGFLYRPCDI